MKRFGSIFPFVEQGASQLRMGRLVANHDFIKALLAYSNFDSFFFSNPSINNLKVFRKLAGQWGLSGELQKKIVCVPYSHLASALHANQFHLFHLGGWGYFMPGLHYLRNKYACNPWPITGVIHSLNGRQVIDQAVRLSQAQMAPYDSIICTSQDGQQALRNLLENAARLAGKPYRGRLDLLPLGIDDGLANTPGRRGAMRQTLKIPEEALVLLVLGRITHFYKADLAPFLNYFSRQFLPMLQTPAYLLIAGGADSNDLHILKQQVAKCQMEPQVRILANFQAEMKPDILAAADIYLALSDNTQETFGLSILEAHAAGLPVVASQFDGFKDLVRDGIDGFLIDTYWSSMDPMKDLFDLMDPNVGQLFQAQSVAFDIDQLHQKLKLLAGSVELRKTMGEIGRNKVLREYIWSKVIKKYERLWDHLAQTAKETGLSGECANPYNFDQFCIYGHYATRPLSISDKLEPVPFGNFPTPYEELESLIDEDTVVRFWELSRHNGSVGDLIARSGLQEEHAWLIVTWMIKYHLLRVTPEEDSGLASNFNSLA